MRMGPSDFYSTVAASEPARATVTKKSTWPCRQAPPTPGKLHLLPHDHLRPARKNQDG
jgi:hypothetical protein